MCHIQQVKLRSPRSPCCRQQFAPPPYNPLASTAISSYLPFLSLSLSSLCEAGIEERSKLAIWSSTLFLFRAQSAIRIFLVKLNHPVTNSSKRHKVVAWQTQSFFYQRLNCFAALTVSIESLNSYLQYIDFL